MARNINKGNYEVSGRLSSEVLALPDWEASVGYLTGDIIRDGVTPFIRLNNGKSGLAFDAAEKANWSLFSGPAASVGLFQDRSGPLGTPAIAAGDVILDLNSFAAFDVTLTENLLAATWSWLPATPFQVTTIRLRQDATGGRTVNFSAFGTVVGASPSLSVVASASPAALFRVMTFDNGATRYVLPILSTADEPDIDRGTSLPDAVISTLDCYVVINTLDPIGEPDGFYFRNASSWLKIG